MKSNSKSVKSFDYYLIKKLISNFKKILICLPPLEKQNEIASHITQIRSKANALKKEGKEILEQAKQEVERMILGN